MPVDEEGYAIGYDYQCSRCHKIFHGPGAPADPGREIASADHPRPLSHAYCKDCDKQLAKDYFKYKKDHP